MVTWDSEANDRLLAAIIAANPGKIDYNAIATMFGQGANYDTIKNRLRKHRKMADELKAEAAKNGVFVDKIPRGRHSASALQTPRRSQNKVSKAPSASTGKGKNRTAKGLATPSQSGSKKSAGQSLIQAILVHSDEDEDGDDVKKEEDVKVKTEVETAGVIPSVEESDAETAIAGNTGFIDGVVASIEEEDVFITKKGTTTPAPHRMAVPPADSDDDEYMDSDNDTHTPQTRGPAHSRPRRAPTTPRRSAKYSLDSSDDEAI
ncbi:uncharacterized protein BDV17DRAFT_290887 [Aspergillus undulatus]|uniref:uncharacterized protein n=1 Tax=Aspergillus undulatus TaxID=1810928 RepID=UPI003CCE4984